MRVDGRVQDLRQPLADGDKIQLLTTRDREDPDALAVLRHSSAHLLAEAVRRLYPGVKIAIGPPIENGFYYDFEFPEPIREEDLERIEEEIRRELKEGRSLGARGDLARRGAARVRGGGRAVQGRARGHGRGGHHPLHAVARRRGRVHRPVPRPAPAGLEADQGAQAHRARRRLLARRLRQPAAHAHLRHRLLPAGGPRRPPRAARARAPARPPPARQRARPLPLSATHSPGLAVLAPEGHGDLERARGSAAAREPRAAATSR